MSASHRVIRCDFVAKHTTRTAKVISLIYSSPARDFCILNYWFGAWGNRSLFFYIQYTVYVRGLSA